MTAKTRNPYLGMHPDLFPPEGQYPIELKEKPSKMPKLARALLQEAKKHESPEVRRKAEQTALRKQAKRDIPKRIRELFGIAGSKRAVTLSDREAEILAAAHRGETPVFAELESLTTDQIRELPRRSFTDDEWDRLDEDDQEYIIENDTESQARVDALADPFIDRWQSEKDGAGRNDDNAEEYFHSWLGNRRRLFDLMPDRMYERLIEYGDERGIGRDEVREFLSEYLGDPSNYSLDTDRGDYVWDWEVEASVYVEGSEIAALLDGMTEDEKERAVAKINDKTDGDISPDVSELDRVATRRGGTGDRGHYGDFESDSFQTGVTVYANIDWDHVSDAIEETIRDRALEPEEDDEDEEIDLDKIEITGKVPKLPRPAQPVVYEWPDGTTMVDIVVDNDEIVGIAEALGILGIPWDTKSKNKNYLKERIISDRIRYHGRDEDGMPTFRRGELSYGLESLELNHCVGWAKMGYMDAVRRGEIKILSMRHADPQQRPIFTIEASIAGRSMLGPVEGRKITSIQQIKGFNNWPPGFKNNDHVDVDSEGKINRLTGAETEEIIKKFRLKGDDVQKIIEWVLSVGVDPHSVHDPNYGGHDLWPALNVIQLMADREDPWAMELQAKIDRIHHASTEDVMAERRSVWEDVMAERRSVWSVRSEHGWRTWNADSDMHAREQHHEAHPGENIIEVIQGAPNPVTWIITGWDGPAYPDHELERVAATEMEALEIARSNYPEYAETIRARRANPASSLCEHGSCDGFCRPYRRLATNPTPNPEGDSRYWVVGVSPPARPGIAKFDDALKVARRQAKQSREPVDIVWGVVSYAPLEGAKTDIFGRTIVEPTGAARRARRMAKRPKYRQRRRPGPAEPAIPLHVVATVLPDGTLIVHSEVDVPARYSEGQDAPRTRTRSEAGRLGAARAKRRERSRKFKRAVAAALDISRQFEESSSASAFVDAVIEAEKSPTQPWRGVRPEADAAEPTEFRERMRAVAGQIAELRSFPLRWVWRQVYRDGHYGYVNELVHEVVHETSSEPRITISYDIITPESAEDGDVSERGWDNEDGIVMEDEGRGLADATAVMLRREGATEPSSSSFHSGVWYTEYGDRDPIAGEQRNRAFHLHGFTEDQEREVHNLFTGRRAPSAHSTEQERATLDRKIVASLRIVQPLTGAGMRFVSAVQRQLLTMGITPSHTTGMTDQVFDQYALDAANALGTFQGFDFGDEGSSHTWAYGRDRIPALRPRAEAGIVEALAERPSPRPTLTPADPAQASTGTEPVLTRAAYSPLPQPHSDIYREATAAMEPARADHYPVEWARAAMTAIIGLASQRAMDGVERGSFTQAALAELDSTVARLPNYAGQLSPREVIARVMVAMDPAENYRLGVREAPYRTLMHRIWQETHDWRVGLAPPAQPSTSPTPSGVDNVPDPWFDDRFRLAIAVCLDVRDVSTSIDEGEANRFITAVRDGAYRPDNAAVQAAQRQLWEAIEYAVLTGADPSSSIVEFARRVHGMTPYGSYSTESSAYQIDGAHIPSAPIEADEIPGVFRRISDLELRIARVIGIDIPIRPYVPGGTVMTGPLRSTLDFLFLVFEYIQANHQATSGILATLTATMSGLVTYLESMSNNELGGTARRAADIMTGNAGPPWWIGGFRIVSQLDESEIPSALFSAVQSPMSFVDEVIAVAEGTRSEPGRVEPALPERYQRVYDRVIEAMNRADEIGGPEDDHYTQMMGLIFEIAQSRAAIGSSYDEDQFYATHSDDVARWVRPVVSVMDELEAIATSTQRMAHPDAYCQFMERISSVALARAERGEAGRTERRRPQPPPAPQVLLTAEQRIASMLGLAVEEEPRRYGDIRARDPGAHNFIMAVLSQMAGGVEISPTARPSDPVRSDANAIANALDDAELRARVRDAADTIAQRVGSRGWRYMGELIPTGQTFSPSADTYAEQARREIAPSEPDQLYGAFIDALRAAEGPDVGGMNLSDDDYFEVMNLVQSVARGRSTEGPSYGFIPTHSHRASVGPILSQIRSLMAEAEISSLGQLTPEYRRLMGRVADYAEEKISARRHLPLKDMSQVIGQPEAVAAVERAVATHQNILLTPAWLSEGATYLIERIPTIMKSPAPLVVVSYHIIPPAIGGGDREGRREGIVRGTSQLMDRAEEAAGGVLLLEDIAEFNTDGLRALKAKLLEMTYPPLIVGTFKPEDTKTRIDMIDEILKFPIRATILSPSDAIKGKRADGSEVIRARIAAGATEDETAARYRAMEMGRSQGDPLAKARRFMEHLTVGTHVRFIRDTDVSDGGSLRVTVPAGSRGAVVYNSKDAEVLAVIVLGRVITGTATNKVYWDGDLDLIGLPFDVEVEQVAPELEIETPEESAKKIQRSFRARLRDGTRIRFVRDVAYPPHFTVPRGELATITYVSRERICAKMDMVIPGAEEWDNEFCWDGPTLPLARDFEIYEEEAPRMIELNPTDNPGWVTKLLAKHLEFLEENVPARWLPKLTAVSKGRGAQKITAAMREYGCGAYGCVLPTLDPKVVLKVTTDDTEYQFAKDLAHKLSVQVTVEYHLVIDAPETYKGRNVYMLWRDSAERVGEIDKASKKRANTVENAVDVQHKAAQQAYVDIMQGASSAIESIEKWVGACRDMGKIVPELHALSLGMIKNLQKNKVFMGDVHAGNIGRVGKRWLVIDPGNIAVLKK